MIIFKKQCLFCLRDINHYQLPSFIFMLIFNINVQVIEGLGVHHMLYPSKQPLKTHRLCPKSGTCDSVSVFGCCVSHLFFLCFHINQVLRVFFFVSFLPSIQGYFIAYYISYNVQRNYFAIFEDLKVTYSCLTLHAVVSGE